MLIVYVLEVSPSSAVTTTVNKLLPTFSGTSLLLPVVPLIFTVADSEAEIAVIVVLLMLFVTLAE